MCLPSPSSQSNMIELPTASLLRSKKYQLVLTMGDPAGIGPEIILNALTDPEINRNCQLTVVGSRFVLQETYEKLKQLGKPAAVPDSFPLIDIPLPERIIAGEGNTVTGAASFAYLDRAIAETLAGNFQGIITAPIAKFCWQAAGYNFPGQTEVLAERAGSEQFGMFFAARSPHTGVSLRVLLATTHIPLAQVPQQLTPQLLADKLALLVDFLQKYCGIASPTIAIAGLNPHSGEAGKLGREEVDWIIPWLEKERQSRPEVELLGPVPPDTLWVSAGQAWYHPRTQSCYPDAYLALYHDQGLIPLKLLAFDQAVNTTIGLPFIRTSPDHGTAFDIAGQGIARSDSLKAAIALASEMLDAASDSSFKNNEPKKVILR